MTNLNVAVLGAGNMGTAIAQILALRGHSVRLWDFNPETVEAIRRASENKFLPGVKLSKHISADASMEHAVKDATLVVVAVASPFVRATGRRLAQCLSITPPQSSPYLKGRKIEIVVAHVVKGLEEKTNLTMHEVIQSELPPMLRRGVVTISGPSIAKELVVGTPTAVVAASQDRRASELVRSVFESDTFKVETSLDWKGVSICGALKNVYAIALGMCDGMRLTMNAKAFLFTVALTEMERAVRAFGGKHETVYGLAGVGDLVVTGLGDGRNRALGEQICEKGHCKFVWNKNGQTHEGVVATKVFYDFARAKHLDVPLLEIVYRVLFKDADPCKILTHFFAKIDI